MKKLCVFFAVFACGSSFSMITNAHLSARSNCFTTVFKKVHELFRRPETFPICDLGGSLMITGITFYQLANVRDRQAQLIRAIDNRMEKLPQDFFEYERPDDNLWKAREAVKNAGDKLNDTFKYSGAAGVIIDGVIKYVKSEVGTPSSQIASAKLTNGLDVVVALAKFPLIVSSVSTVACFLNGISDLNCEIKKAKRLLNTPKYRGMPKPITNNTKSGEQNKIDIDE